MSCCIPILLLAATTRAIPRQGFVGVYNAATGVVQDGANTSAYDVGQWSPSAVENAPEEGGLTLEDDLALLCDAEDANQLWGMLIAASEGGVFNNPNDTSLLEPLPLCANEPPCPDGATGMLQGAARW